LSGLRDCPLNIFEARALEKNIANQVWAREKWSDGVMDSQKSKNKFFRCNPPRLQYSITPSF
jgi:hypothetical protein